MERVSDYDGAALFTPQAGSNDFFYICPSDILCGLMVELFPQNEREKKFTQEKQEKS